MAHPQRFSLRQHFALTLNRYDLCSLGPDSIEGPKMTCARATRMPLKQHVTFYADDARTQPIFDFKPSRKRSEVGDTYDVEDDQGQRIDTLRKDVSQAAAAFHLVRIDARRG